MKTRPVADVPKKSPMYTPFGYEVKRRLLNLDMSLRQLEDALGMPCGYARQIVGGYKGTSKYITPMAEYLGIDLQKYVF